MPFRTCSNLSKPTYKSKVKTKQKRRNKFSLANPFNLQLVGIYMQGDVCMCVCVMVTFALVDIWCFVLIQFQTCKCFGEKLWVKIFQIKFIEKTPTNFLLVTSFTNFHEKKRKSLRKHTHLWVRIVLKYSHFFKPDVDHFIEDWFAESKPCAKFISPLKSVTLALGIIVRRQTERTYNLPSPKSGQSLIY